MRGGAWVARGVGDAYDEADVLVNLGLIDQHDEPAKARSHYLAARTRAADAGNLEIELRALRNLALLESGLGNLATARALFDEGAQLAEQTGLSWSRFGSVMHLGQVTVRYRAGDWDDCEQLAGAIPELVTTLAVAFRATLGLPVQIARGRSIAAKRLRQLAAFTGVDPLFDTDVAPYEAELATWQGDLERARSAIQRALAGADAIEHPSEAAIVAWVCMKGLTAEAERAERARAAGDAAALTDANAVGHELLERARAAAERAKQTADAHNVYVVGHLAKAAAEWTRLQGRSDTKAWQAAIDAFSHGHVYAVARCRWRLAEALLSTGDREQATVAARAAHLAAVRLGAEPLRVALEALARRGRLDLGVGLPAERTLDGLTPRELEVLRLLVEGRSNRQIAETLFISGKTAGVHVTNLMAKLGVHSRLEAAATARRLGVDVPTHDTSAT